jgi:23S rRNA (guanine2445-N2)-methyltransferase / 23S rRNA (guanine2069-N7)-methyltransferase
MEPLLVAELQDLGAESVRETVSAVTFSGSLETGYRACLWSRLASRLLLQLTDFPAATADELYAGVASVAWEEHVPPEGTLTIDAVGSTAGLTHSGFAARKAKDAVVDRLRDRFGTRPSVEFERPDVRLNLRLHRERGTLSIDLAGEPLHRRGYRTPGEQGEAPLKETLAAAILLRAGWGAIAEVGGALLDPMCGSGTLLAEGALIAADQAPGLLRDYWGFSGWLGHEPDTWERLLAEADDRAEAGRDRLPLIAGWDADPGAVELARGCLARAGFGGRIPVEVGQLAGFTRPSGAKPGLVATNPPHGLRIGESAELGELYATLGERLLAEFDGWQAAVFTPDAELARATGLRSVRAHRLFSGAVESRVYIFEVRASAVRHEVRAAPAVLSAGAEMFANRLRKNLRHLGKWARREGVTCFRVYDADLPDFAVAVDLYEGAGPDAGSRLAHVQEYAAPPSIDPTLAAKRLEEAVVVVADVLAVSTDDVVLKVRQRQRGSTQYERQDTRGEFVEVAEGGLRLLVNLRDYLDTGLFLDARPVRARLRDAAAGRRFLNLFGYTGTASVYAADGGATSTTTVDLSATYLDWARRTLALNGFTEGTAHSLVQADALVWLKKECAQIGRGRAKPYDLVYCDPPTFSTSKRMGSTFDVERDHAELLNAASGLLSPDGLLVFTTNRRGFALDSAALGDLDISDITPETIPPDFSRTPRIHTCFEMRPRA